MLFLPRNIVGIIGQVLETQNCARTDGKRFILKRFNPDSNGVRRIQCNIWGVDQVNKLTPMIVSGNVIIFFVFRVEK